MWRRRFKRRWPRRRWRRRHLGWKRKGWRGRRHHFKKRVRRLNVSEWVPGRRRNIVIRGWEPLANVCEGELARTQAEPYKCIEPKSNNGQWHGTWGYHYFTLNNLQLRSKAYWNMWSDNWASFDYVKLLGIKIWIPADQLHSWMISFDPFLQTKTQFPLNPQKNAEETWIHPGIMINRPNTHLILPQNYHSKARFYRIKLRPPPGWKGFERFPEAMDYIMCHWAWTIFSLNQPFYDVCNCPAPGTSACMVEPWWCKNKYYDKWPNRTKYEDCNTGTQKEMYWGPFLQGKVCNGGSFSPYFLYKIYLQFAGDSIWRPVPTIYSNSGLVPEAPGPSDQVSGSRSKTYNKKRPRDTHDILPGDLDSDGFIKEGALTRIIGDNTEPKRRKMGQARRLRYLAGKLRRILADRHLLRRGMGSPGEGPTTYGGPRPPTPK